MDNKNLKQDENKNELITLQKVITIDLSKLTEEEKRKVQRVHDLQQTSNFLRNLLIALWCIFAFLIGFGLCLIIVQLTII